MDLKDRRSLERELNELKKSYRDILNSNIKLSDEIRWAKEDKKRLTRRIERAIEYIRIYRSYQKIDNKDYLKGRDEIGCLDIYQVDELLDILKEVSE